MTKKQATELFQQGHLILVVEYRSGAAEAHSFRDKETGRQREFSRCAHQVECGNISIQVGEFLPDGASVTGWVQPFKKGTACILRLKSLSSEKGLYKAQGVLEALTAD